MMHFMDSLDGSTKEVWKRCALKCHLNAYDTPLFFVSQVVSSRVFQKVPIETSKTQELCSANRENISRAEVILPEG